MRGDALPRPPQHAKSIAELATIVGVNEQTLRQHSSEGCPMPATEPDVVPWSKEYHVWRKNVHGGYHDRLQARSAKDEKQRQAEIELATLKTAELKLRVGEKTRQLVSRKEVVELASKSVLTVKQRLNAMVQKMQGRLENVPSHVVAEELQAEVDDICRAFAQSMRQTHDRGEVTDA